MPAGRPKGSGSKRTPEAVEAILAGLSKGIVLGKVLEELGIGRQTVYDWISESSEFAGQYARARDIGYDAIAESCFAIADDGMNDTYTDDNGKPQVVADVVQRSKLRVWTRLELLKRWDPKRYGDRQAVELTGKDGGPIRVAEELTDAELARIAAGSGEGTD